MNTSTFKPSQFYTSSLFFLIIFFPFILRLVYLRYCFSFTRVEHSPTFFLSIPTFLLLISSIWMNSNSATMEYQVKQLSKPFQEPGAGWDPSSMLRLVPLWEGPCKSGQWGRISRSSSLSWKSSMVQHSFWHLLQ